MAERNVLADFPLQRQRPENELTRLWDAFQSYAKRTGEHFTSGMEQNAQGFGDMYERGNVLTGVPRMAFGGLSSLGAPVSAALEPLLSPYLTPAMQKLNEYVGAPVERATGYPADLANELALLPLGALGKVAKHAIPKAASMGDAIGGVIGPDMPLAGAVRGSGPPPKGLGTSLNQEEGITAYHGSPHDFDKFDMSKIGTGEGAQAYGHGLYFAEAEDVAKTYKAAGPAANQHYDRINKRLSELAREMDAIAIPGQYRQYRDKERGAALADEYDSLMEAKRNVGNTYQVKINVKPDELLDWDKPLSEQPKAIRSHLENMQNELGTKPLIAGGLVKDLGFKTHYIEIGRGGVLKSTNRADAIKEVGGDPKKVREVVTPGHEFATEKLRAAGIKGIRYKDQGSRGTEGGTYNYVVFDDKLVTILKKYGIPMTAGAGGAMMVAGQDMPPEIASQMGGT